MNFWALRVLRKSNKAKTNEQAQLPTVPKAQLPSCPGGVMAIPAPEEHLFVDIVCITRPSLPLSFVAALHAVGQHVDFYALVHVIWLIYPLNLHGEQQSLRSGPATVVSWSV